MNETTLLDLANELAEIRAKEDAKSAAEVARAAPEGEPVQFITGNSFMPPLRAWGSAEDFWQASHEVQVPGDKQSPWETYFETFDEECKNLNIDCECPDYDNALYVVDLARFEYVEREVNPDGSYTAPDGTDQDLTLNDDWQVIER